MTRGIVGLVLLFASAGASATPDGQKLFVDKKCNKCHSVDAKGIAALPKEKDGDEDGEEAKKPKDLSKVGAEHDAAYVQGWMKREIEKDGKKHKFKLKATDEEIAALSDWLAALK